MTAPELLPLQELLRAIDEVCSELGEARDLFWPVPATAADYAALPPSRRTASRAFIKSVEQLQDLTARAMRMILLLEAEEVSGLSARAMADRAESIGLIGSSDRWSAIVKLRNRLVHEYPLAKSQQLARLQDAANASPAIFAILSTMTDYLRANGYGDLIND